MTPEPEDMPALFRAWAVMFCLSGAGWLVILALVLDWSIWGAGVVL